MYKEIKKLTKNILIISYVMFYALTGYMAFGWVGVFYVFTIHTLIVGAILYKVIDYSEEVLDG